MLHKVKSTQGLSPFETAWKQTPHIDEEWPHQNKLSSTTWLGTGRARV